MWKASRYQDRDCLPENSRIGEVGARIIGRCVSGSVLEYRHSRSRRPGNGPLGQHHMGGAGGIGARPTASIGTICGEADAKEGEEAGIAQARHQSYDQAAGADVRTGGI